MTSCQIERRRLQIDRKENEDKRLNINCQKDRMNGCRQEKTTIDPCSDWRYEKIKNF